MPSGATVSVASIQVSYIPTTWTVFMGFFAIMNPIAGTPIFLSLTDGDDASVRRAVARRALLVACGIVLVFSVFGHTIFSLFGIGLPAFTITGGLLVLLIGFHMVQGRSSGAQHPEHATTTLDGELDKAVSPLGMPLLAGPGTIATAISFSAGGLERMITTLVMFLVLCIITYFFFVYGQRLVAFLGHEGMAVITRLMGLILAAIGVQMVISAVTELVSKSA